MERRSNHFKMEGGKKSGKRKEREERRGRERT